jgi:glycosyltransferase involved in cell wall biosynthesis
VFTWHEVWDNYWYEYLGKTGFFGKTIERAVSKISKKNIAVSHWTKKRLESLGVPEKNITVIPNGIDLKRISQIEPERSLTSVDGRTSPGFQGKIYDIIFAGRLIKEKNVDVLLRAVFLLKVDFPGIKCCIVGDGPEKAELLKLAKKLAICENVDFVGFQAYEALIGKVKASKMLILPSSREGFGMVVIEAFACGVPVVTVKEKYNAAQGLVEDGVDGFVVKLGDKEIAAGVEKIIKDYACYKRSSDMSLRKSVGYDWNKIVEKICSLYIETV